MATATALRWIGLLAFLAIPVIAFLGRSGHTGCEHPTGPCDPIPVVHPWQTPLALLALSLGVLALLVAALADRSREGDA
jgi:hypothetical protein